MLYVLQIASLEICVAMAAAISNWRYGNKSTSLSQATWLMWQHASFSCPGFISIEVQIASGTSIVALHTAT